MANPGVEFIVIDEFEDTPRVVDNISLKIEPKRTSQNLDYKVLIPLQIKYSKKKTETLLKVTACPDGSSHSATYRSFRGQFISPVLDEKSGEENFSIPHQIDQKGSTKKTYVERCTWEEGKSPQIQLITNRKEGVIDLHFLAILGAEEEYLELDTSIGIKICVEELENKSGRTLELGKFIIDLDENAVDDFPYEEEMMIRTFEEHSHQVKGNGSCIHPKQLITVELLRSMLNKETIEYFGGKIDLGYIGLDTGENILSVLRYLDREELTNMISSLNIFYEEEWDELYRKRLGTTIANCGINVNWVEINSSGIENYKVDFMISTYVAVWAANEEKIQTAEHEEYFKNSYEWCKDKAFLISVDPLDPGKIARSHRYTAAIDVTSYYKKAGFEEIKEVLFQGVNQSCKDSVWKKGDINYKTHFVYTLQDQELVESEDAKFDTYTVNETTKFIQDFAGEIECAGIPANAAKLVLADVLKDKSTEFVVQDGWASDSKTFGIIMPKRDNLRCSININKFDVSNKQTVDGKLVFDSYLCGDERLEFEIDFEFWEDDPDKSGIDSFIQSIAEMFETGLLEAPLAVYSPFPVLITGLPGEGKSVRMKQIVAEISSNDEIIEVPIFLKAKHLAKYIEKQETADYMSESSDFREYADIIAKAFIDSNPLAKKLTPELVLSDLLEINSNISDDDDCGLVLVVDAIDEIVELESIRLLLQWLDDFSDRYGAGHSRCVISTRPSHEEYVGEVFPSVNKFNMYFETSTLRNQFPQKLVSEWRVNDIVSEKVTELIQDVDVFEHINKPLLIGWLCRFVKDGKKIGDLKTSYNFYEKILDQAVTTKRFTTKCEFSELEIDSIKRMRDCIAFVDLLAMVKESTGTIELTNKTNRLRLLSIRHSGFFPGLEKLSDEEAHRLFFEDMSLIFVSGSGQIAWTHDHLREFSASLLWCLEPIRRNDLFDVLSHEKYKLFNTDIDFYSTIENEVLPHKKYFREAIQNNPNFSPLVRLKAVQSDVWKPISSSRNTSSRKLQSIRNKIVHRKEVHPSEYAELLENESFVDDIEVNDRNKKNFIIFAEYFFQQDINWLFGLGSDSKSNFVKTYLELITGGVISKLAEKLLDEEERADLFKKKNTNSIFDDSDKFDYTKMKAMIFENFIKSSDNYDIKNYTKIWNQNFQPKDIILDKNNLNLDYKSFQKLFEYYNKIGKESKNSTYIFNKINTAASPINNEEKIALLKLQNAREDGDLVAEWQALSHLAGKAKIRNDFDDSERLYKESLSIVRKIGDKEGEAGTLFALGANARKRNNFTDAETWYKESLTIRREIGDKQGEASILYNLGNMYSGGKAFTEAERLYKQCLTIRREIGDKQGEARTLNNLAIIFDERGDFADAEKWYKESLTIKREIGDKEGEARTLNNLAIIFDKRGDFAEAEPLFKESLTLEREVGDKEGEANVLRSLAINARYRGELYDSDRMFKESLTLKREVGDKKGEANVLRNLAINARYRGETVEVERLYKESLTISREIGDKGGEARALFELARNAGNREELADSDRMFKESLTISREIGDRRNEALVLCSLALNASKRGEFAEAERLYKESLTISREIGDRHNEAHVIHFLAFDANERGELAEAERLYKESLTISREIGDKAGEARTLANLGICVSNRGGLAEAKRLYKESLIILREIGNQESEAEVLERLKNMKMDSLSSAQENMHEKAKRLTKETGIQHEVDHIIPLSMGGKSVPENMQIISSEENRKKANKLLNHNSNLLQILERNMPLEFDILGMSFFIDERYLSKLLRMYWTSKPDEISNPVNAIIMNRISPGDRKKGEEKYPLFEIRYQMVDGRKNLLILFAAIIEAYRRLDNLESMPDNFHKIRYQDNTDEGSIVDLLTNHEDYGDDVSSFVENINTILDSVQNQGKLEDFIQSVSEGRIRVSLVKTDKSRCKDCGHTEFETREDGDRYCKSCGALDEDSLYDFGPEG